MDLSQLEQLLTVNDVAEMFDVEPRIVRREARKNNIPGAIDVLGRHGFDPDKVKEWEPPEPGTRRVGARREDGRQRYRIYLSPQEYEDLKAKGFELVDPREAAKARRAARKAKKAAAAEAKADDGGQAAQVEQDEEDPFADFE